MIATLINDVARTVHKQEENIIRECLSELISNKILVYKSKPPTFEMMEDGKLKVAGYGKLESCHQELIDQLLDTTEKLEYLITCLGHEKLLSDLDETVAEMGFKKGLG